MNLMPNIMYLSFWFSLSVKIDLKLEIESAFLEFFVFVRVEPEQLRRTMPTGHLGFLEPQEQPKAEDFLAEIALVQFGFENRLIKILKLGQGEFGWQQLKPDGLVPNLPL